MLKSLVVASRVLPSICDLTERTRISSFETEREPLVNVTLISGQYWEVGLYMFMEMESSPLKVPPLE